ncbi:MAG: DinB family protein [Planctomycetota bacterium]
MPDEFLPLDPPRGEAATAALRAALDQFTFARHYTRTLLDATPMDLWFQIPAGFPANVAWQVGHMTVASYGLLLFRIRGRQPEDLELIPGKFRKAYGKGSHAAEDPSGQPDPATLLEKLERVWEIARRELPALSADILAEPIDPPFAAYATKLGGILFCPLHEHTHAGQIGMLRRGLGLDPVR